MNSLPETRASLVLRLQNGEDLAAWDEFASVYAPVIYRTACRIGLQPADAEDCVQEVLTSVAGSVGKWIERDDRGGFRAWLFRITRNTSIDFLTRRRHRPWAEGGDANADRINDVQARTSASRQFDLEFRREIFARSSEIVRTQVSPATWQAFYRTSVLDDPIAEVAAELSMSIGSVYIARSRVMKRLQQTVKSFKDLSHDEMQ